MKYNEDKATLDRYDKLLMKLQLRKGSWFRFECRDECLERHYKICSER